MLLVEERVVEERVAKDWRLATKAPVLRGWLGRILRFAIVSQRTENANTTPEATRATSAAQSSVASTKAGAPVAQTVVSETAGSRRSLRDFWQIPLIVAGLGAVAGAVWFARGHTPKDDFAGALDQASELIAAGEFAQARHVLEQVVEPNLERAPADVKPRFFALGADFLAGQQKLLETPTEADARALIDAYDRAKALGWTMTSSQSIVYSQSLVRLGRASEALAVVAEGAGEKEAESLRRRVKRDALDSMIRGADAAGRTPETLLAAIDEFRADPTLPAADAAWAAARAAEVRIALGELERAADRLLVDLSRLESMTESTDGGRGEVEPAALAELYGLRGEALRRLSRFNKAREEFEHAVELAQPGTAVAGSIDVGLGKTLLELGADEEAARVFDRAVLAQHKGDLGFLARLGRAEARSNLGHFADAQVDFGVLRDAALRKELTPDTVTSMQSVLIEDARDAIADKRWIEAIEFAQVAIDLRGQGRSVADAFVVLGTAAREEANRLLTAGGGEANLGKLTPEDRAVVNRLLKRAGDMFAEFSVTPECRQATDGSYVASLRNAAECYDMAGWHDLALGRCQLLLEALEIDDPDRGEVYLRIAAIREAEGAYAEAATNYRRAIDVRRGGSDYTARAIVPLARSLDADGRGDEAIASLQQVLSGEYGLKPEAVEYFNALDLLARIQQRKGKCTEAAELLHEAIARIPDQARLGELRFRLGEAYLGVARAAMKESETADLTAAAKARLVRESVDRFKEARRIYDDAIVALEDRASREGGLDGLSRDMLREAHMRRADCAFDVGPHDSKAFEDAIALYEAVDRKYPDHPSSMVALIQIVNACDRLGDAQRASIAHRRAQLRLAQLPDDAFFGTDGILSRESWEQWLRNHPPSKSRVATGEESKSTDGGTP